MITTSSQHIITSYYPVLSLISRCAAVRWLLYIIFAVVLFVPADKKKRLVVLFLLSSWLRLTTALLLHTRIFVCAIISLFIVSAAPQQLFFCVCLPSATQYYSGTAALCCVPVVVSSLLLLLCDDDMMMRTLCLLLCLLRYHMGMNMWPWLLLWLWDYCSVVMGPLLHCNIQDKIMLLCRWCCCVPASSLIYIWLLLRRAPQHQRRVVRARQKNA